MATRNLAGRTAPLAGLLLAGILASPSFATCFPDSAAADAYCQTKCAELGAFGYSEICMEMCRASDEPCRCPEEGAKCPDPPEWEQPCDPKKVCRELVENLGPAKEEAKYFPTKMDFKQNPARILLADEEAEALALGCAEAIKECSKEKLALDVMKKVGWQDIEEATRQEKKKKDPPITSPSHPDQVGPRVEAACKGFADSLAQAKPPEEALEARKAFCADLIFLAASQCCPDCDPNGGKCGKAMCAYAAALTGRRDLVKGDEEAPQAIFGAYGSKKVPMGREGEKPSDLEPERYAAGYWRKNIAKSSDETEELAPTFQERLAEAKKARYGVYEGKLFPVSQDEKGEVRLPTKEEYQRLIGDMKARGLPTAGLLSPGEFEKSREAIAVQEGGRKAQGKRFALIGQAVVPLVEEPGGTQGRRSLRLPRPEELEKEPMPALSLPGMDREEDFEVYGA